jgi:tetratricopeptide (TPR) repeat protein
MFDQNEVVRLFEAKNYKKVLDRCTQEIGRDNGNLFAHFYSGLASLELKLYDKAIFHFKKIKKLNPKEPYIFLNIGCIYEEIGRDDLAIRNFKKEISLFYPSPEANFNLGKLYFRRRSFSKALPYFLTCKKLGHCIEDILVDTAFCLNRLGLIKEEIAFYKYYLRKNPNDVWCLQNLGAALIDVKQYRKSLRVLEKAKESGGESPSVRRNLGLARKGINSQPKH